MVPDAPARVVIGAVPPRLVVGQRVRATADVYTKANDRRENDVIAWKSGMPAAASVDADGVVTALAPGRAAITAADGAARASVDVVVVPNTIADVELTPRKRAARTGDVVRFAASPKDASGRVIAGLTPTWSFSPGHGQIDADGAFVAYEPGTYVVTASFGQRSSADAIVKVEARDVRRPVRVVGRLPRTAFPTREVWIHPERQGRLPRHRTAAATACTPSTSPTQRSPVIVDSIQVNTRSGQRHDDDPRRQLHGVHARGRGRPQERHRHRRHPRSAAPEGDQRVHRRASPRACTRRSSTRSRSTARTSTSPTTAPARCT